MIALIAAIGASLILPLALVRLVVGPTLYDRALAAKTIAITCALIGAAFAAAAAQTHWLDAVIALLLGTLVLMTAVTKVFRARTFQPPMARGDA